MRGGKFKRSDLTSSSGRREQMNKMWSIELQGLDSIHLQVLKNSNGK